MMLRGFLAVTLLTVLSIFVTSSSSKILSFSDVPSTAHDEIHFCGIQLKRAQRKFCRKEIIEKFLEKEPMKIIIMKTYKKCEPTHVHACCKTKCSIATFVKLCPYRYVRKR